MLAFRSHALERTHESGERTWIRMCILASNILRARLELYSLSQTYECDRVNAFGIRWRTWPALPPCLHFFECELQKLGGMVIEHSWLHVKHESINWHVYGFSNVIGVRPQGPAPFSTASFDRAYFLKLHAITYTFHHFSVFTSSLLQ